MKNEVNNSINRILVSLDFDSHGSLFIEPLVSLASQLEAELCGLFIENPGLQQVANLPFSREITFPSAHIRNLNSDHIARHLKQHANTIRKMMKEMSQLSNVECSFRTTKEPHIESLLNESFDFQLIVLLPDKYSSAKTRRPTQLSEIINPAVLFYDDSEQSQKSAHFIKSLANNDDLHQLKILTLDHDSEIMARQKFKFEKMKIEYNHIDSYKIDNIISLIGTQKTGLLILPLETELINQSTEIRTALDTLGCPLMLIR